MNQQLQDRPITGNGDGPIVKPDSFTEFRTNLWLAEQGRVARQLRNAVRRVVALHAMFNDDLESVKSAAWRNLYEFVRAAVDERRTHDHCEQLTLELVAGND